MIGTNFLPLKNVCVNLYNIGCDIEDLFYSHPEASVTNMRKFAEGVLQEIYGNSISREYHVPFSELIKKCYGDSRFDSETIKRLRNIQYLGNSATHFQIDSQTLDIKERLKALRDCYHLAKFFYVIKTGRSDYPSFVELEKPTNSWLDSEENTISEGWFSYYRYRINKNKRLEEAEGKSYFVKLMLPPSYDKTSENLKSGIEELIDKFGDKILSFALAYLFISCFYHEEDSKLETNLALKFLQSWRSESTRNVLSLRLLDASQTKKVTFINSVISLCPVFSRDLLMESLDNDEDKEALENEVWRKITKELVDEFMLDCRKPELIIKIYINMMFFISAMFFKDVIKKWSVLYKSEEINKRLRIERYEVVMGILLAYNFLVDFKMETTGCPINVREETYETVWHIERLTGEQIINW